MYLFTPSSFQEIQVNAKKQTTGFYKFRMHAFIFFMFALVAFNASSQVTLPHLESINYTAGGTGLQVQTGWTTLNTGDDLAINAGSLSYSGLPASVGNKVIFDGAGIDAAKLFTQQTTGTVYYSFLLNITSLGSLNTTGGYFTGFTEGTGTNFGATIWTRKDVNGTSFNLGINPRTTAANTAWSSALSINSTYFVVISYQIVSGTLNDVVKMWINPVPGASEPAATASATNTLADLLNVNRILIRQDAATTTPFIQMDELRIGTSWADVTPSGNPPVVTPGSPTGTVGAAFNYNIIASNSPTTYAIASGTLPSGLTLTTGPGAGAGTISGTPTAAGSSSVDVTATNGNGTSSPATLSFTINPGSQTITGFPLTDSRTYTAALQQYNLSATGGASGNPVTYSSDNNLVASIIGNQVTINGAGTANITASQAGDANYNAATPIVQVLTVDKATQTISFGSLADRNDVDPNFQLTATGGGSGNPVTYTSSVTTVCQIVDNLGNIDPNGSYVDIVGPGQTYITASQAGNDNYYPATSVQQLQNIINTSLLPQVISFGPLPGLTYGDAPYQLTATGGGSGNPVTYSSSVTSVAIISDINGIPDPNGSYIKVIAPGTTVITANQAGNGSYNAASPVQQTLNVAQKTITLSGATASDKPYDGTNVATITGGTLQVLEPGDIVTFSGGGVFDGVDAGPHTVTGTLVLGGADFAKYILTQPTFSANITQVSQTITFSALPSKTYGDADYILTATGGASGQPVTFSSPDPYITITGNSVHINGAGTAIITASQAGDINYAAATDVSQSQLINQAVQTITFAALPNKTTADAPFALTGTVNSPLTISYSSSNPAVADVVGNTVTIYGPGVTNITASQSGDANYLPATSVVRSLIVTAPLIAAWDFTGPGNTATFAATLFNADLNSSNLVTRGATAGASTGANSFRTTGFKNEGISTTNTDYFQVTLSVASGKTMSLSDITGRFNGTNTFYAAPGVSWQFAYSLDGTNFNLIGSPSTSTSTSLIMLPVDLTGVSALQDIPSGTTVTIRYYASGQTTTGGWGFFSSAAGENGLAFGGSISNVPCAVTGTATTTAVCSGNSDGTATVTLTGSGSGAPGTYTVDGGSPVAYTTNPFTITGLSGGAHSVIATVTAGGCESSVISADVTVNPLPNVSFSGLVANYCTTDGAVILLGNQLGGIFSGPGITGSTFDPASAGAGTHSITYSYTDPGTGCSNSTSQNVTVSICPTNATLNLNAFLEGYYDAADHMRPNNYDLGISADPTETDTLTVGLWSPGNLLNPSPDFSAQTVVHTDGVCTPIQFPAAVSGNSFYIQVKHRNHIETWSADPVLFSANTPYDFTTSQAQAYDDGFDSNPPMAAVAGGKFAFYAGDVNQDGGVDGQDASALEIDVNQFAYGYNASDANGDGSSDGQDASAIEVNANLFIYFSRPL